MLAMRESSVIRDKERSREFMNRQKLLFERFSQRKSSEFERVKETFNIDSIDILEQAADISEQAVDTRCSRNMLNRWSSQFVEVAVAHQAENVKDV